MLSNVSSRLRSFCSHDLRSSNSDSDVGDVEGVAEVGVGATHDWVDDDVGDVGDACVASEDATCSCNVVIECL